MSRRPIESWHMAIAKDFIETAKRYEISFTQATTERDEPMLREDLVLIFKAGVGRLPTESEIFEMRPDSQESFDEQIQHYRE